jgi:hypothetical protein
MAAVARESGDLIPLFWHVLAWGVAGDFRNMPAILRSGDDLGRPRLNEVLTAAANASHRGDIDAAYRAIHGKVNRFGPAFFTKFLYFTGDRASGAPRCMILDSRVAEAVLTLTGTEYFDEKPQLYGRFCHDVWRWADQYGEQAEAIEFRLYKFGQLIGSRRWRWLHAEASLYRAGATEVGFQDIVREVAAGSSTRL